MIDMRLTPDRRAAGLLRAALGVLVAVSLPHAIAADDAAFSRALSEARCIPAHVALLREEKDVKIFAVRCQGDPPRTLGLACRRDACSVESGHDGGGLENGRQ